MYPSSMSIASTALKSSLLNSPLKNRSQFLQTPVDPGVCAKSQSAGDY